MKILTLNMYSILQKNPNAISFFLHLVREKKLLVNVLSFSKVILAR